MGICNKAAGILSPIVFAAVILRPTDTALFAGLSKATTNADALQKAREMLGGPDNAATRVWLNVD